MVTMSVAVNISPIQEWNHIPHTLIDLSTLFFFVFFLTFYMDKLRKIHRFRWKVICWKLTKIYLLNPSNPVIKIWILICCPYLFPTEVGRVFDKILSKFILSDHVRDSHDHSVLQGEIWCWSLLGLKGLKVATFYRRLYGKGTNLTPTIPTWVKFSNFVELYLCSLKTFHFQLGKFN